MNPFSQAMIDTLHVANVQGDRDDFGNLVVGQPRAIKVRWQPGSYKVRDANGAVVETRDVFYTAETLSSLTRVWTPGMNPSSDTPLKPTQVMRSRSIGGSVGLTKVVL